MYARPLSIDLAESFLWRTLCRARKAIVTAMTRIESLVDGLCRLLMKDAARSVPASNRDVDTCNAVLVIDASPSMLEVDWKPSRLEAAQQAARAYVQRLWNEDPNARVAVIAYSRRAKTMCDLTPARGKTAVQQAIGKIDTCSYTNIAAGMQRAFKILKGFRGPCQVVLLTDGQHNCGGDPSTVAKRLRGIAVVESIGIGGTPADVDEDLLKDIASAQPDGSKRYRWIGDRQRLVQHFQDLAGRLARG